MTELTVPTTPEAPALSRKWVIFGGRVMLALLLLLAWEIGARTLGTICARHGVELPTAAIHFSRLHPSVSSVVLGAVSPAEV